MDCVVYRCQKQADMYLYLRTDLQPDALPETLLRLTGRLSRVMALDLGPDRKLARVDALQVIERLQANGYYLQMPPEGQVHARLHFGD
jgi:uncharacterized protein YcgL (UPF0745 family)